MGDGYVFHLGAGGGSRLVKLNFRTFCVWFLVAPIDASSLTRDFKKSLGQTTSSPKNACGRVTPNAELAGIRTTSAVFNFFGLDGSETSGTKVSDFSSL